MFLRKLILSAVVVGSLTSTASAITITDTFIGSGDFAGGGGGRDVIGDTNVFDTSKVDFTLSADRSYLTLTIFSNYFNKKGALGTTVGSLFLNTAAPGTTHVAGSDGASWNYGVKANNVANVNAGSSSIYSLTSRDSLLLSDQFVLRDWTEWRKGQEVDVNSSFANLAGNSSWEILGAGTPGVSLSFYIPVSLIGGTSILNNDISFSWAMTCANDVVRGSGNFQAVPEPTTMLLLGAGALGAVRRKRKLAA
jgi:hypothetical protein